MNTEYEPLRFIGEQVEVEFEEPPLLDKKPGCPDRFIWSDATHQVVDKLGEWHDYSRKGRFRSNMRPDHAAAAERRGSWGVGRDYYRVETGEGRIFDIYYDRAPRGVSDRKGRWVLFRELSRFDRL
jgi:hypothetical protein